MNQLPLLDFFSNGGFDYSPGIKELPFDGVAPRFAPIPKSPQ